MPSRFLPPAFLSTQVSSARRFYFPVLPRREEGFSVFCGGIEHCRPDYRMERRSFPFYGVEFVAAGRGGLELGGRRAQLEPGSVFAYGPGLPHRIISSAGEPLVKYFADFAGRAALDLAERLALPPGSSIHTGGLAEIRSLFESLIAEGLAARGESRRICQLLGEALLRKIASERNPLPSAPASSRHATYLRCREILARDFREIATLGGLARRAGLSAAYLCRLYQEFDHETPYDQLIRLRMNAAADLLSIPGAAVKTVAATLGYDDAFHFSRAFKRVHGLSPLPFRNMIAPGKAPAAED